MNTQTQTPASGAKYRVLGTNDDASSCCCCGREGLKRVVWLQPLDASGQDYGVPVHFGTMCAAKACGWGYSSKSDAERRILKEQAAALKHYRTMISDAMKALLSDGLVVQTRLAYGWDYKSATWNYGYIYTLPDDAVLYVDDPASQRAAIPAVKLRLRAKYPVFEATERNLSVDEMRAMLKVLA